MREEEHGNKMYQYLTEQELEALIAEVEDHEMLAPPVYLKELIMEEAVKSAKPVNTAKSITGNRIDRKTANIQFMVYSLKIIGAAAAAIFCLTMVPMDMGGGMEKIENQRMEEAIEKDVAHYREESERILSEPVMLNEGERGFRSILGNVSGSGIGSDGTLSSIWNRVTGWFGNGGKEG